MSSYDYIIVGAGASGCLLANRLSADSQNRVLLLEAGPEDTNEDIHNLGGFTKNWGSDLDWKIETPAQPALNGRQVMINQGKVMGGSTSINALMYVRGNALDFDRWNEKTGGGWSYRDVLPYFKRSENYAGGESEYHGVGGGLEVCDNPDENSRSPQFLNAAVEAGYDGPGWDYNGARQENGAGLLQLTVTPDGRRSSAVTAFLDPISDRSNLTVERDANVSRVILEGKKAVGVEYVQNGKTARASAEREIVLSAGAFFSPHLLMLSGIGPAAHLKEHGIDVKVDLPGVGQNLQDHLQLPVVYRTNVAIPTPTILTGNVLFVNTRSDDAAVTPDLQLNFTPAVPLPLAPILDFGGPACIFLPIMVQPRSIGEVRLGSADPSVLPVVNPNYLQDEADVQTFIEALKIIRRIADSPAFSELNGGELVPGRDADVTEHARNMCSTLWHPAGTCQMGLGEEAVVDPELRVKGVDGLRVADASVMPIVTSGNTLAGCYMIGEKAAEFILNAS